MLTPLASPSLCVTSDRCQPVFYCLCDSAALTPWLKGDQSRAFGALRAERRRRSGYRFAREVGGGSARLPRWANFAAFIRDVKPNNWAIMRPWPANYKRVKRCTKGTDRCHLSLAGSAVSSGGKYNILMFAQGKY